MRMLKVIVAAGLLFAAAAGCHEKKDKTTPTGNMGDAGTQPIRYPPAQ